MSRTRNRPKSTDEKLAELRASQAREEARIRAEPKWTEEAKREALERSHAWFSEKYNAIIAEDKQRRMQRKEQLEKKLFSPTSQNRASYRQALEQASKAEHPDELRRVYDQGILTNDTDLAQAAVYHALQRGYDSIVNDYSRRRPEVAQALEEYSSPQITPSEVELFRERLFRPRPEKAEEIRRNRHDVH